jgi:anti-sigma B factor antagonist
MVLSLGIDRRPGVVTIAVAGEVDLATSDQLDGAIIQAIADADKNVMIELSGLNFCDSTGIRALVHGRRLADSRGVGYRVVGAVGIVRDALEAAGVWQILNEAADEQCS